MPTITPIHVAPLATAAIQAAIDQCHAQGGGRVVLGGGKTWVCGTINLRSHVELHLEAGAVLQGSTKRSDYAERVMGGEYEGGEGGFMIFAQNAENIAITGLGTIEGQSLAWMNGWRDPEQKYIRDPLAWRPRGIGFIGCRNVRINSLTIRDMAQWTVHLTLCDDVVIQGITILNRLDVPNCDGIDPDHCRNVRIMGCHIEAGDDCIVLKNTKEFIGKGDCSDITVQGCTLVSTSAAMKIGTESQGDFKRIVMTGCVIRGSHRGICMQLRDHGTIEDVIISDCVIESRHFNERWWGNAEPIYITAVPRRAETKVGTIRRVRLKNLICRAENGIIIHGWPGAPIQDLTLDGVILELTTLSRWSGGRLDLRPMNGAEHGGQEASGNPAVLVRHAQNLTLKDIEVRFADPTKPWWTHALDADDVDGLRVEDFRGQAAKPELAAQKLERCRLR